MTSPPPPPLGPDDDLTAAEYVLGTLPHAERQSFAARLRDEAALRAAVAAWEARLHPLAADYGEIAPPPAVWHRIETRLFRTQDRGAKARLWSGRMGRWILAGGGLALAAMLGWAVLRPLPAPVSQSGQVIATLQAEDLRIEARHDGQTLDIQRIAGPDAAPGRDYELWLIAPGAAPQSLGLLRGPALRLTRAAPPAGWVLAVSLEPLGGSPTGAPTGPVLGSVPIGG